MLRSWFVVLALSGAVLAQESAWTLLQKGIQAYQRKNYQSSERLLAAALRHDERCFDAYFYLGLLKERQGKAREAVALYGTIDPENGTFSLAAERQGHLALKAGKKKEAIKHFVVHAEARPSATAWMQVAAVQLELKEYTQAEVTLDKASKLTKGNLDLHDIRGRLFFETKRNKEALGEYGKIVKVIPSDTSARYMKSACLRRLDRKSEAGVELRTILKTDPYHRLALKALVASYGDDPTMKSELKVYRRRLDALARTKPKVRKVSGKN